MLVALRSPLTVFQFRHTSLAILAGLSFRCVVLVLVAASDCGCLLMCRPLPAVVMPCLGVPLATILGHLKSVFPPAAACLAAQGASNGPTGSLASSGTPDLMWDDDEEEEEDQGTDWSLGPCLQKSTSPQDYSTLTGVLCCDTSN